jgi:tRNA 2-thiouridine synthesizing protein E
MMTGIVPSTFVRALDVNGKDIFTDSEGYILNRDEWSEDYVRALASKEGLVLTDEHWDVVRFQRVFFGEHGVQANVREMIKHFRKKWGPEKGSNRYLREIFPRGGPQKQGNRLAGLLRTKGEH